MRDVLRKTLRRKRRNQGFALIKCGMGWVRGKTGSSWLSQWVASEKATFSKAMIVGRFEFAWDFADWRRAESDLSLRAIFFPKLSARKRTNVHRRHSNECGRRQRIAWGRRTYAISRFCSEALAHSKWSWRKLSALLGL